MRVTVQVLACTIYYVSLLEVHLNKKWKVKVQQAQVKNIVSILLYRFESATKQDTVSDKWP
jgi:hypothetical protein